MNTTLQSTETPNRIAYRPHATGHRFHEDKSFVRGIMGPIGSGKSTTCIMELFMLASRQQKSKGVRKTRFAVVRNTYRELTDTVLKSWEDWFPQSICGPFRRQDMTHHVRIGDIDAEFLFRALDRPQDVKKLLSMELTGAWINEAREVPGAVISMIQGRIGRYPRKEDGGPTQSGLIMDTNPPGDDSWWYKTFETRRPENWKLFRQPSGRSPQAENIENLPPNYYRNLILSNSEDWVKVYVDGEYGFVREGHPVYPEFVDSTHVSPEPLKFMPRVPVYIGIDFGLTPAAVMAQRTPNGRWLFLREITTEDMGALRFGELLASEIERHCPDHELIITGDPAGEQRADSDESTCFQMLKVGGVHARPAHTNDFTIRREAVANTLRRMVDGKSGFLMCPSMSMFRTGMAGKYYLRQIQASGDERYKEKPEKNMWSHVCEAAQYCLLGGGEGRVVMGRNTGKLKKISYSNLGLA